VLILKTAEKPEEKEGDRDEKGNDDEWEPLDNLPPPYPNNPPPAAAPPSIAVVPPLRSSLPLPLPPIAPELDRPPAACTRSRTAVCEGASLYPLRKVPLGGNQAGIGSVAVPLNTIDVRNFKKKMGTLLDDPSE